MSHARTVCHRCGSTVVYIEFSVDKVNVAAVDDLKYLAFWCDACSGVLCAKCADVDVEVGAYGFCPVCEQRVKPATERQIDSPMSTALKKPLPAQGFFGKLFGSSRPAAGTFAYLFVVTRFKQPTDSHLANQYLLEVANICAPGWTSTPAQSGSKMAALWDADMVDRGQLIAWAGEAFGEEFKAMSTKYDLSFSRFEHSSATDKCWWRGTGSEMSRFEMPYNNSMQQTVLRAAADAGCSASLECTMKGESNEHLETYIWRGQEAIATLHSSSGRRMSASDPCRWRTIGPTSALSAW